MISIILPNLNSRQFIKERLQTIIDQTYQDWEVIVIDAFSDDGSFDIINHYAKNDMRFKIYQFPREGIYPGINKGIELSSGEFIYIATADDTMEPDCLEKMVAVLEAHPECGLAHCNLKIIDDKGNWIKGQWENYLPQMFYVDWIFQQHIRKAPLDGILHFAFRTVYTSLTQLLIRKLVFDRVGLFPSKWGSQGDFDWEMRASLLFDTIHVPEYLASWRVHGGQATANTETSEAIRNLDRMVKEIMRDNDYREIIDSSRGGLEKVYGFYGEEILRKEIFEKKYLLAKVACIVQLFCARPYWIWAALKGGSFNEDLVAEIKQKINDSGLDQNIVAI